MIQEEDLVVECERIKCEICELLFSYISIKDLYNHKVCTECFSKKNTHKSENVKNWREEWRRLKDSKEENKDLKKDMLKE